MSALLLGTIKAMDRNFTSFFLRTISAINQFPPLDIIGPIDFSQLDSGKRLDKAVLSQLAEGLRQMILTRVPGWAVTQVRFEYKPIGNAKDATLLPVLHRYAYIPGIVESLREITTNLQKAALRLPDKTPSMILTTDIICKTPPATPYKDFLLGELFEESEADMVINPELKLFTFQDSGSTLSMELTIEKGRGYRSAQQISMMKDGRPGNSPSIFNLSIDAKFNPVRKVGFAFDDKGELWFTVETDGSVSPLEAFKTGLREYQTLLS